MLVEYNNNNSIQICIIQAEYQHKNRIINARCRRTAVHDILFYPETTQVYQVYPIRVTDPIRVFIDNCFILGN